MQYPKHGIARRPRDIENFLRSLVDEINGIKLTQTPMRLFLARAKANIEAKEAKAKAKAAEANKENPK